MGRIFLDSLGGAKVYNCRACATYLTNSDNLVSVKFTSGSGSAYLFRKVVNVYHDELSKKEMLTGEHMVRDIICKTCRNKLGWMYELAFPERERYKEGSSILECAMICEVEGLKADPNFEPYSSIQPSVDQSPTDGNVEPTRVAINVTNRSALRQQLAHPSTSFYPPFHYGNIASINDLAALINGLNSHISAQAFVDATAAVASASIARRSGARIALNRAISNISNMANTSSSASSNMSASSSSGGGASYSTRSRHVVPNTNASAQMARRSLRSVVLPASSSHLSGRSNASGSARTRQAVVQRQPPTSRGSTSSSGSTTSSDSTSSSSAATSTTFSPLPDNFSVTNSSSLSNATSSSASTSPENEPSSHALRVRRLSIHMNPSHSVEENMDDVRELRSGRRISRSSGSR